MDPGEIAAEGSHVERQHGDEGIRIQKIRTVEGQGPKNLVGNKVNILFLTELQARLERFLGEALSQGIMGVRQYQGLDGAGRALERLF